MKKKIWIPIVIAFVLIAVLAIPISSDVFNDGGTREYTSLTYKIVDWNRLTGEEIYDKTKVYFFPNNFKSLDDLCILEEENIEYSFLATILEINGNSVLVEPAVGEPELRSSDKISFGTEDLENIDVEVGSVVEITYTGKIMESYPAQIFAPRRKM